MPPLLHPHLKRGLDLDDFHIDPEDIIEDVPRGALDPEEQIAKRRRIERIAAQCLRGRRPVILAAGLRGPFDEGWKNPWAKAKKCTRRHFKEGDSTKDNKTRTEAEKVSNGIGHAQTRRHSRRAARGVTQAEAVASPETSRAVGDDVEDMNDTYTLEAIEIPPATAPSSDENDVSGATEFFSVDTGQCVRSRSPLTNPFWLRRPESGEKFDMKRSANTIKDASPTRPRDVLAQNQAPKALQVSVPRAPLGARIPLARAKSQQIISSASASMVISSPGEAAAPTPNHHPAAITVPDPVQSRGSACERPPENNQSTTSTQSRHSLPSNLHLPGDQDEPESTRGMPSREVIQRTAERLVEKLPSPSGSNCPSQQHSQEEVHVQLQRSQHDLAASSAPNSSTSFAHKKVATKWTINNAPRSKPRAVNFNSSPSIKNGTKSSSRVSVAKEGMNGHPSVVADMPSQAEEGLVGNQNHDQEQQNTSTACRRSSDHSMMSTQAAMLLAQLEFQESTYPTSSHGTYRPWSQIPDETPRSIMPELSPAITPLSMFRPQLEQPDALTSVLRDAPISTQELFAAASPFAFSTVKKKPIAPQHSNLRVTTLSFDATEQRSGDTAPQSPSSSAGRRPLQEKNTLPSPWKRTFGKGARGSQTVKTNRSSFCSDVESPRLGLDGPMGSYGSDESFHPANHLLCDLQGT